jgi:hypothetical protein
MKKMSTTKHLGKSLLILSIVLFSLFSTRAQTPSVIQKVPVNGQYSRHTITKLNFLSPDKYNIAVNHQLGVIGNDFWAEQKLPETINYNSFGTATDYHSVNGYKTTLSGKLIIHEFRDPGTFGKDDDLQLTIVCNPKNSIGASNYPKIKNRHFNDYPYPYVEGEIDIDDGFHKYYNNSNISYGFPSKYQTDVCLYGPWVQELYDYDENKSGVTTAHLDVHEIHPAEQFWWVEKVQTGFRYYLNAANDASGRFAETGWASNEFTHSFAIAFDIRRPGNFKEKLIYNIDKICAQLVTPSSNDSKKHYLVLGKDTLIEVVEPQGEDLLSISFESVGIDPFSISPNSDTLIKGFVVIQSKLNKEVFSHGNVKFRVDKKSIVKQVAGFAEFHPEVLNPKLNTQTNSSRTVPIQEAIKPHSIKISLKEITTLENKFTSHGSDGGRFKLRGYIFAEKETIISSFSKSTSQILEGKPLLLFPLNGPDNPNRYLLHNRDIRTNTYNNSITLSIKQNESINILTDFVASYETGDYIRTLELIEGAPYYELKILPNSLIKGQPVVKEIILHNRKGPPSEEPKEYKMKIKIEVLLLD